MGTASGYPGSLGSAVIMGFSLPYHFLDLGPLPLPKHTDPTDTPLGPGNPPPLTWGNFHRHEGSIDIETPKSMTPTNLAPSTNSRAFPVSPLWILHPEFGDPLSTHPSGSLGPHDTPPPNCRMPPSQSGDLLSPPPRNPMATFCPPCPPQAGPPHENPVHRSPPPPFFSSRSE